jgi:hypothetical protein
VTGPGGAGKTWLAQSSATRWDDFLISLNQHLELGRLRVVTARAEQLAGGHRMATVRVRVGQRNFRRLLLHAFGSVCAFTGPTPPPALEACHLYSYSIRGEHHPHGGLLLRRDVHRLFDSGYLAVDPTILTIDVFVGVGCFSDVRTLRGQAASRGCDPDAPLMVPPSLARASHRVSPSELAIPARRGHRRVHEPEGSIKGSIPTAHWRPCKFWLNEKLRFAELLQSL